MFSGIKWVTINYRRTGNQRIFRGTQDLEIIKDIDSDLEIPDFCLSDEGVVWIFDIKNTSFIIISEEDMDVDISTSKPSFRRRIDKFGNSFI